MCGGVFAWRLGLSPEFFKALGFGLAGFGAVCDDDHCAIPKLNGDFAAIDEGAHVLAFYCVFDPAAFVHWA